MSNESEIKIYINASEDDINDLINLLNKKQITYTLIPDKMLIYTKADLFETRKRIIRKIPLMTYKEMFDLVLEISKIALPIAIPIIYDWWKEKKKKKEREKKKGRVIKKIEVKYRDQEGTVFELTKKETFEALIFTNEKA